MYTVEFMPIAQNDMVEIVRYISRKLMNPTAAERLADKMIAQTELLKTTPYAYPAYYPLKPLEHEYRRMTVDHYLIFYWVDEEQKRITIARVIYAGRNYQEIIK